jgi:hypothetical protein
LRNNVLAKAVEQLTAEQVNSIPNESIKALAW